MRVYLDNCCYNRPYDNQAQLKVYLETQAKLEIQRMIMDEELELVTSYILEAENAANPFNGKRSDIQSFIDMYTSVYVSRNRESDVQELADEVMKSGIKTMDAYHIACAEIAECDVFFTTDKRVLKYSAGRMRIINPVSYIVELEGTK